MSSTARSSAPSPASDPSEAGAGLQRDFVFETGSHWETASHCCAQHTRRRARFALLCCAQLCLASYLSAALMCCCAPPSAPVCRTGGPQPTLKLAHRLGGSSSAVQVARQCWEGRSQLLLPRGMCDRAMLAFLLSGRIILANTPLTFNFYELPICISHPYLSPLTCHPFAVRSWLPPPFLDRAHASSKHTWGRLGLGSRSPCSNMLQHPSSLIHPAVHAVRVLQFTPCTSLPRLNPLTSRSLPGKPQERWLVSQLFLYAGLCISAKIGQASSVAGLTQKTGGAPTAISSPGPSAASRHAACRRDVLRVAVRGWQACIVKT